MIKTVINKFLKAALDEVFIDAGNVQMSMGADLFSESTIHLKNLTFRPDIFDICLQPLRLISGHLGKFSVDGLAELALGSGKIRCQLENVFLLFGVDENADAEQVQVMKKLLLELQGRGPISRTLLRDLLKKIQGFQASPDPDLRKKRKLLLKILNYVFKNLMVNVKSVHIRIEVKNRGLGPTSSSEKSSSGRPGNERSSNNQSGKSNGEEKRGAGGSGGGNICSAVGITIPQFKLTPNSVGGVRPDGVAKEDPILSVLLRSLQVFSCSFQDVFHALFHVLLQFHVLRYHYFVYFMHFVFYFLFLFFIIFFFCVNFIYQYYLFKLLLIIYITICCEIS
jgi:N-terminal region of Chorein or VPS13